MLQLSPGRANSLSNFARPPHGSCDLAAACLGSVMKTRKAVSIYVKSLVHVNLNFKALDKAMYHGYDLLLLLPSMTASGRLANISSSGMNSTTKIPP